MSGLGLLIGQLFSQMIGVLVTSVYGLTASLLFTRLDQMSDAQKSMASSSFVRYTVESGVTFENFRIFQIIYRILWERKHWTILNTINFLDLVPHLF
eukprot:UN17085